MTDDELIEIAIRPPTWEEYLAAQRIAIRMARNTGRPPLEKSRPSFFSNRLFLWLFIFTITLVVTVALDPASLNNVTITMSHVAFGFAGFLIGFLLVWFLQMSFANKFWYDRVSLTFSQMNIDKFGIYLREDHSDTFWGWTKVRSFHCDSATVIFGGICPQEIFCLEEIEVRERDRILNFVNARIRD